MMNSCMSVSLLLGCFCFVNGDSLSSTQTTPLYTKDVTDATSVSVTTSTRNNYTSQDPDNSTNTTVVSESSSSMSVPTSTTNNYTSQDPDNSTNTTVVSESSSSMSVPTDTPTSSGILSVAPSTETDGHKEGLSEEGQLSIIVVCVIVGTSVIIFGVAYLSCYFNKQKKLTYEQRNTVSHMNGTVPKLSSIENGGIEMNNLQGGDALSVSNHNPSPHPSV